MSPKGIAHPSGRKL